MDINGERTLPVSREIVWDSLFDTDVLMASVPGCQSVVRESDTLYRVTTVLTIGPLKAKFNGTLTIADAQAPEACTLLFEGQGGAVGMAKGSAKVTLETVEGGTKLVYKADSQISGKLAQVGSRLIESVAKKLSAVFFDKFEEAVKARQ
ncbi:CoxG family protein [Lacisediminimonas sp.]|jgi:carbon monoxide dehydrogenase subunit G|uniref:CoxG family protein n=1 Tax=Lacisediminimonas sp. TaxID=3060582 RepID=UPI00271A5DD8|nr:carbon monoxide dehydrogenase subunit G [Lacisediminimonas sp.]MDO8300084.1 carbon monoxide dehydrogenase subunit G [Lacisediminimonas sp.]MDO9216461.1 carbon monoxide dehydrogenase subunit G [Lacisediminimonas sp.]